MDEQRLRNEGRLAGWAGIVFSILSLIVVPLVPVLAPPLGSTPEALRTHYTEHRWAFLIGNYLGIAAFFPGFIQLAIFAARVRRKEDADGWLASLVLTTGTFAYSVGCAVLLAFQTLPFLSDTSTPEAMLSMATLANAGFALFMLVAIGFVLSVAWAVRATGIAPAWFVNASVLVAIGCLFASFGALWTTPMWLAGGGLVTGLGFMAFFGWTFVLAVLSFRTSRA